MKLKIDKTLHKPIRNSGKRIKVSTSMGNLGLATDRPKTITAGRWQVDKSSATHVYL